eukprot:60860-Pyramimonas_sp.AAC.1
MALTGFVDDLSCKVFEAQYTGTIIDKLELGSRLEHLAIDKGMGEAGASHNTNMQENVAYLRGAGAHTAARLVRKYGTTITGRTKHHARYLGG